MLEGIQQEFPLSRAFAGSCPAIDEEAESIESVMLPSSTPRPLTHTEITHTHTQTHNQNDSGFSVDHEKRINITHHSPVRDLLEFVWGEKNGKCT